MQSELFKLSSFHPQYSFYFYRLIEVASLNLILEFNLLIGFDFFFSFSFAIICQCNCLYFCSSGILQKMKEGAEKVELKIQAKVESFKNVNEGEKGDETEKKNHFLFLFSSFSSCQSKKTFLIFFIHYVFAGIFFFLQFSIGS